MSEIKRPELPQFCRTTIGFPERRMYDEHLVEEYGLACQRYGMLLAAEICEQQADIAIELDREYGVATDCKNAIRAEADKLT